MDVEFQEDNTRKNFQRAGMPKLAKWLISKGMASDLDSANKLQVVVSLIFIALAILIYVIF